MNSEKVLLEQVRLVNRVDSWAQENDSRLDAQFSQLFGEADEEHSTNGYMGIAKGNPGLFERCYGLALLNKHRVPEDFY